VRIRERSYARSARKEKGPDALHAGASWLIEGRWAPPPEIVRHLRFKGIIRKEDVGQVPDEVSSPRFPGAFVFRLQVALSRIGQLY